MDWYSLILPISYLTILIGSLWTFSYLYRRRQTLKALTLQPWFPEHQTRAIYLSLLELQSNAAAGSSSDSPKVPDTVIRAALMRRAVTDIHRLMSLRNNKPALMQLLQRGSVGDELYQRFQVAEKEMEAELKEVVEEANALAAGWGQLIFQSANEMAMNELMRKKLKEVEEKREGERERWVERRESVRQGFMKELEKDEEEKKVKTEAAAKREVKTEKPVDIIVEELQEEVKERPSFSSATITTPRTGSSDDDAVLVEREPNNAPGTSGIDASLQGSGGGGGDGGDGGNGGGSAKKKKKTKK